MFEIYTDSLFNYKIILKSQQRFKFHCHDVYTDQINRIAVRSNGNKRLQTLHKITIYSHGTNAFKVCENEVLLKIDYYKHDNEDEIMFAICENKHKK